MVLGVMLLSVAKHTLAATRKYKIIIYIGATVRLAVLGLDNFTGVGEPRPRIGRMGTSTWRHPTAGLERRTMEEQVATNLWRWLFQSLTRRLVSMGLGLHPPFSHRGHGK